MHIVVCFGIAVRHAGRDCAVFVFFLSVEQVRQVDAAFQLEVGIAQVEGGEQRHGEIVEALLDDHLSVIVLFLILASHLVEEKSHRGTSELRDLILQLCAAHEARAVRSIDPIGFSAGCYGYLVVVEFRPLHAQLGVEGERARLMLRVGHRRCETEQRQKKEFSLFHVSHFRF